MPQAYRLTEDNHIAPWKKGQVVYNCLYHDYGLASDDARAFGEDFRSMTADPSGNYPTCTVPVRILEKIDNPQAA
jgi:hypothetical protein